MVMRGDRPGQKWSRPGSMWSEKTITGGVHSPCKSATISPATWWLPSVSQGSRPPSPNIQRIFGTPPNDDPFALTMQSRKCFAIKNSGHDDEASECRRKLPRRRSGQVALLEMEGNAAKEDIRARTDECCGHRETILRSAAA